MPKKIKSTSKVYHVSAKGGGGGDGKVMDAFNLEKNGENGGGGGGMSKVLEDLRTAIFPENDFKRFSDILDEADVVKGKLQGILESKHGDRFETCLHR